MDILNRYLFQHKSISIPGLGSLYLEGVPAMTDFANKRLFPPQSRLRFDKYFDAPEREFFSYLAHHKKVADYEAIKWYNEFAYDLRASIRSNEQAVWEGIGTFKKDVNGEILFEPFAGKYKLLQPVAAERVIRTDATHALQVGDRERTSNEMTALLGERVHVEKESWWLYALIIAAVSLLLIFFYFYKNGWQFGNWGSLV